MYSLYITGFFEIKLCPIADDSEETTECFEKFPLEVVRRPSSKEAGSSRVLVVSNITCITTGLRQDITDRWCEEVCVQDLYNCPVHQCRCTIDVISEEEPVRRPEVTTTTEPGQAEVVCEGWGGYKGVPSMEVFCRKSCLETVPAFCPPHVCRCSEQSDSARRKEVSRGRERRCWAVGDFSSDDNMSQFCEISCSHPVPHCPPQLCQCRCSLTPTFTLTDPTYS